MKCDGGLGELMDKLDDIAKVLDHNLMKDVGIKFPEIAVIGMQTVGKSSVLERITVCCAHSSGSASVLVCSVCRFTQMLPLFPRGKGIVTRMPIKLRLMHLTSEDLVNFCDEVDLRADEDGFYIRMTISPSNYDEDDDDLPAWTAWAGPLNSESTGIQSDKVTSVMNDIMRTGTTDADGVNTGVNKDFLIKIEVKSRTVPNIVLVDLPGIVGGAARNEPSDMPSRTEELVTEYLENNETLVLIVDTATTASVCNSRAFTVARECGKLDTSMVVLTKCDVATHEEQQLLADERALHAVAQQRNLAGRARLRVQCTGEPARGRGAQRAARQRQQAGVAAPHRAHRLRLARRAERGGHVIALRNVLEHEGGVKRSDDERRLALGGRQRRLGGGHGLLRQHSRILHALLVMRHLRRVAQRSHMRHARRRRLGSRLWRSRSRRRER